MPSTKHRMTAEDPGGHACLRFRLEGTSLGLTNNVAAYKGLSDAHIPAFLPDWPKTMQQDCSVQQCFSVGLAEIG